METQLAGQRSIDKVAGIGGTHLEKDAQLELAQGLPVEGAVQIVEAITPCQCVNAHARAFAQDVRELFGRARLLLAPREPEIVVLLAQVAEALQSVNDQIQSRRI